MALRLFAGPNELVAIFDHRWHFGIPVRIKRKFDTLSGVIAQENVQSIGLLKLDAERADWGSSTV